MNIQHSWKLFQRSFSFDLTWCGKWRILKAFSKFKVACGIWCSVTIDEVLETTQSTRLEDDYRIKLYRPLCHHAIRLLYLLPGVGPAPLQGRFRTKALFSKDRSYSVPEYTALSYAWGVETEKGTIVIDNVELLITQNLYQCLRQLRHGKKTVTFWIDSICINQEDVSEKTQQVELMHSIYSHAQEVAVWLGEASEHSSTGMKIIEYFATHPQPRKDAPWMILPQELVSCGLRDIMTRAYFQRIWVVQEVVLGRRIRLVCGGRSVSWGRTTSASQSFLRMIKFACILPEWRHKGLGSIEMEPLVKLLDLQVEFMLAKSHSTLRQPADALDIAYDLRHRLSSDPRDMLFSIFGMVEGLWNCEGFKPDYQLSVAQSYDQLQSAVRFCDYHCLGPEQHMQRCHDPDRRLF